MYSYENTIIEIYNKLNKLGKLPKCENDLKYEKKFKENLYDLYKQKYISESQFEELKQKCDEAMLGDEAKGFLTGVYFILKMQKEMGEDFTYFMKCFGLENEQQ